MSHWVCIIRIIITYYVFISVTFCIKTSFRGTLKIYHQFLADLFLPPKKFRLTIDPRLIIDTSKWWKTRARTSYGRNPHLFPASPKKSDRYEKFHEQISNSWIANSVRNDFAPPREWPHQEESNNTPQSTYVWVSCQLPWLCTRLNQDKPT